VLLNGRQIAGYIRPEGEETDRPFDVELTHLLRPGPNVLIVSTMAEGLSLDGGIGHEGRRVQRVSTDTRRWRAQKLPPLTMLEYEPCMQPDFDDAAWHPVKEATGDAVTLPDQELAELCSRLAAERLARLDEDARWRLGMLADKGIAVVDWEAHGWAGPERLPDWVRRWDTLPRDAAPGAHHSVAQALTRHVRLRDEAANLQNHIVGLAALKAPATELAACRRAAGALQSAAAEMEQAIGRGDYTEALAAAARGEAAGAQARATRIISDLNRCLDSKFGWLDTNALLDNDISAWGLSLSPSATVLASPLSPAALVTVAETELVIYGWDDLEPLRAYKKPPVLGPVCLWAVLDGTVTSLKPGDGGIVYDRAANGKPSENWMLLVHDIEKGGHLPIQLVLLQAPSRIAFNAGENGTSRVTITFGAPGARLFALRPLPEWRGILRTARALTQDPLKQDDVRPFVEQCRLWSRALLNYPVTFSEAFVRDPDDEWALLVADVYNYLELEDDWDTEPLRIAPLPPLATYGLMTGYPGLRVISDAQALGSRGIWGDHIAAVDQDHVVYRVPLDPIKRFGGFTSYCFGPTDIGSPGNIKEYESVKRTGSNSYRPQHNQTGERAMNTLQWCLDQGLQNVFNTDEKWVPDVVEHFRTLAAKCKDYPFEAVAYDVLNEPESRDPRAYNALIRKVTTAIREIDRTHLIYVEVIPPWGPGAKPYPRAAFESLDSTGDALTCYSFHDYEYRLPPRWPNEEHDIRDIISRWIPAFRFAIDNRCAIHLGEFGGFEQTKQSVYDNPCALTLMMDYLRIFDQFGWHWHYYANRGVVRVRKDGSLRESYVQEAYRRYFAGGTFNVHREQ
ncbi:MAG: cellulase family glycosylhydrolase, partial [Armatimonadota bacterium]